MSNLLSQWIFFAKSKLLQQDTKPSPLTPIYKHPTENLVVYLKDESINITGSWRQRIPKNFYLHAVNNQLLEEDKPIISVSPPSLAISEAWYANLLGIPYIAVIPKKCSIKISMQIEFCGGICHIVDPEKIYEEASKIKTELSGIQLSCLPYNDPFTKATILDLLAEITNQLPKDTPKNASINYLTGISELTLYEVLKKLEGTNETDSSFKVHGIQIENSPLPIETRSMLKSELMEMPQVSIDSALNAVELLVKLTGRQLSYETAANFIAILEGVIDIDYSTPQIFIIISESSNFQELLTISKTKQSWLNYRESTHAKHQPEMTTCDT